MRSAFVTCTQCGEVFSASPTGGRPRKRCDACRSAHAQLDGTRWRTIRAQVLAEEPVCRVPGCGRASTEVDHITPLKLGGDPYERANLQGMCKPHNSSKGARVAIRQRKVARKRSRCLGGPCPDDCPGGRWHV